ncbi:unnamed protein product [Phytomonas sp. Hart1]|nr:unnamed protein product [Phytomonas sp. Hart1]|eukprot:CCW68377.1 unnamed protein product [Phytomonas sp. isolate Hart1]
MKARIVAPVYNLHGAVTHTRELDPFLFGFYPETGVLADARDYWLSRCRNYSSMWDYDRREIWRRARKNWPNTGLGMPRVSDRKHHDYNWGGQTLPVKPWNMRMPVMDTHTWSRACRMAATLKMLQGKLQIVERLTLIKERDDAGETGRQGGDAKNSDNTEEKDPTQEAYLRLCRRMRWDVRHNGGGVLFMDGGSRLTPSLEFDRAFFFGSFFNGRNKVVRPTFLCDDSYDYNWTASKQRFKGPKGPKNPIPINRFNVYDALAHHLLVITEGALMQLEEEMFAHKLMMLPPHIRQQLPEQGSFFETEVLGDCLPKLKTIEMEAAARTEEVEQEMYNGYYDNPYEPWKDEHEASYAVDGVEGVVERYVKSKKASWGMLS